VEPVAVGSSIHALGISDNAFALLRDLIEERLGIFYDNGKRDLLADKLAQLMVNYGFQSFLDYYYALKYDADAGRYWSELMDRLSVPETYFWRQPEQFEALARHVVPQHFATTGRPLRIWSAACCSGEEPLSIAIALARAGYYPSSRIEIIASDASPAMIEKARRGLYTERSFRALPAAWRDQYFVPVGSAWKIRDELSARIDWRVVNLLDAAQVTQVPTPDVVFCRNVLIYFSDAAISRLAALLSETMPINGMLFIGAAESLTRLSSHFALDEIGNAFVYINRHHAAHDRG
jgi:chemotaxis protein methyltransferase CheR